MYSMLNYSLFEFEAKLGLKTMKNVESVTKNRIYVYNKNSRINLFHI